MQLAQQELFDRNWQPIEATAMDFQFFLYDDRTREWPFGALVDCIDTQKRGGAYHVKPTGKEAGYALRDARYWFSESLKHTKYTALLAVVYGVLNCLFAIRCSGRMPPVAMVNPIRLAAAQHSRDKINGNGDATFQAVRAIAQVGHFLPNDETAARRLSVARSQAWSADYPGIVILVDAHFEATQPQDHPQ